MDMKTLAPAAILKNGCYGRHVENSLKKIQTVFGYMCTKFHAFITKCTIVQVICLTISTLCDLGKFC